jgi:hypothetical protein
MRTIIIFFLSLIPFYMHAQKWNVLKDPNWSGVDSRKGQAYVYWGYNRASYLRSYIHFKGEDYDFILKNASATDMPSKFDPNVYFNFKNFSIPQFNARVGYFLTDQLSVSLGWDHMKYRLTPTQAVIIDGYIDSVAYAGKPYVGQFNNQEILYTTDFMDFHHSNGFNFVRAAAEYRSPIWKSKSNQVGLYSWCGVGLGVFLPWTDFTFYGERHLNWLHVAGWGASVSSGVKLEVGKHFFAQIGAQFGRSFLGDILLEDEGSARAQQSITFLERSWSVGLYLGKGKN